MPTKQYQVIETTFPLPAPEGYNLSVSATPGEFVPVTFVLRSGKALKSIKIQSSALTGPGTIPAASVDIRLVKTWYQSGDPATLQSGKFLIPELLVKDDALVTTNLTQQKSFLRATVSGSTQYIDITTAGSSVPAGVIVQDAATLQAFSMAANTNKQIWLTIRPPVGTPAGTYTGTITISIPGKPATTLSLTVTVLPFTLTTSLIDQGIYYEAYEQSSCASLNEVCKTHTQLVADLTNLRDHGILYPTVYESVWNSTDLQRAKVNSRLSLMESLGLPKDKIYVNDDGMSIPVLEDDAAIITLWKNIAQARGWGPVYHWGMDEASGTRFDSELPFFQAVHANGGKTIAAISIPATLGRTPTINQVDTVVLYGEDELHGDPFNQNLVAQVHQTTPLGKKVFQYGNPFAGSPENSEYERYSYGLRLLTRGFDGAMNYAYQHGRADLWNDFTYKSLAYTYPTTNGPIDTLQWEGHRVGADDIRYASTLASRHGWSRDQLNWYLSGIPLSDPDTARQMIVHDILATYPGDTQAPTVPAVVVKAISASLVKLTWNASTDNASVNGYKIYRNGTLIGNIKGTTYTDTGLTANTAYTYTVTAYDTSDNIASASLNVTTSQDVILTNGLVGLWTFDQADLAGTTAYDRSGNGYNGTLTNGPASTSGQIGQALSFNGVNNYVDVGNVNIVRGGEDVPFTISMWVWLNNANGNQSTDQVFISNYNSGGSITQYDLRYETHRVSPVLVISVRSSATDRMYQESNPKVLQTGKWHHLVWTDASQYDADQALYINGVAQHLISYTDGSPTVPPSGFGNTTFGKAGSSGGHYFNGLIDDVRIYNRALSLTEVQQLSTESAPTNLRLVR